MALLTSCWFIIESCIIPDGFLLKWFYLSFYIHPIFLCACQIFLWLNLLKAWILVVIFYPLRIICFLGLYIFRFFRDYCVMYIFSFTSSNDHADQVVVEEDENKSQALQIFHQNQVSISSSCTIVENPLPCKSIFLEFRKNDVLYGNHFEDKYYINMEESSSCQSGDRTTDVDDHDQHVPTDVCYLESSTEVEDPSPDLNNNKYDQPFISGSEADRSEPARQRDVSCLESSVEEDLLEVKRSKATEKNIKQQVPSNDMLYKKYTERMRWFDMLNIDRTSGIGVIVNNQLEAPNSFGSNEQQPIDFSFSWSKPAKKRLLKSLESDLEMVYVSQSCLSWEALHYQYMKVKTLADSTSQNVVFYGDVVGEFQIFQILLERFMEDERCQGNRIWNYVHGRFDLKSLLQVPQISGFVEEEKKDMEGESIGVKKVLKAIEKCIHAYWVFVRTDKKKPWWKLKSSQLWGGYSSVENPRDLKPLDDVTRKLQKKEKWMKDKLAGKKRKWLKKSVNPPEENQTKEILFTMIELKLVSKVLQMSTVSSSQIKWCQEKLDNIDFKNGNIIRSCATAPLLLFPSS